MCNEAYRLAQIGQVAQDWGQTRIPLRCPEGKPNFAPLDSIPITDHIEIIRAAPASDADERAAEMVTRRWSWPGPSGKPVYSFRSDGGAIANGAAKNEGYGRCLIPVDGFFEFTDPPPPPADAPKPTKKPPKSKWVFTVSGLEWFCIAGVGRTDSGVGETWAMLTCPPGPDIAPCHSRKVVVLTTPDYAPWLTGEFPAADLCRPLPAGTLEVRRVR